MEAKLIKFRSFTIDVDGKTLEQFVEEARREAQRIALRHFEEMADVWKKYPQRAYTIADRITLEAEYEGFGVEMEMWRYESQDEIQQRLEQEKKYKENVEKKIRQAEERKKKREQKKLAEEKSEYELWLKLKDKYFDTPDRQAME